jgi:hypothetical protein
MLPVPLLSMLENGIHTIMAIGRNNCLQPHEWPKHGAHINFVVPGMVPLHATADGFGEAFLPPNVMAGTLSQHGSLAGDLSVDPFVATTSYLGAQSITPGLSSEPHLTLWNTISPLHPVHEWPTLDPHHGGPVIEGLPSTMLSPIADRMRCSMDHASYRLEEPGDLHRIT